ncbi:MAG: hypothetical protein ACXVBQ_16485 [Pseudobdellovibrionaceae bacterium]
MSMNIKVFDTILTSDKSGDSVSRNSADFWKVFCFSSGWGFNYERIHSLEDIKYFFCDTKIKEDIVIFSGHGDDENGFHLSNGNVLTGDEDFEISKKNHDKIIIFSSCLIGKNKKLSENLRHFFYAQCLFAYRHKMEDRFCFLNESILVTLIDHINEKRIFTSADFKSFQDETAFMKNINKVNVKKHPMEMY